MPSRALAGQVLAWIQVEFRIVTPNAKEPAVLYYCEFTWFPGTSREEVAQRVVEQHDAGKNNPEHIKGWFNLVGGGAGFLLVDYDDPREVTAFLQPYMDLMSFDVRAIYELEYADQINQLRASLSQGTPTI
jgi:hypothetical protein